MMGTTMMKKTLVAALICGSSVVGVGAGSAFAGEVTGNGDTTPIKGTVSPFPGVPAAICAFSGLEDLADPPSETRGPAVTQTPHFEGGEVLEPGVARVCSQLNSGKGFVTPTP
jgi:hypothetical protein